MIHRKAVVNHRRMNKDDGVVAKTIGYGQNLLSLLETAAKDSSFHSAPNKISAPVPVSNEIYPNEKALA